MCVHRVQNIKDLSGYVEADDYICPNCGSVISEEPYVLDNEDYPKIFNVYRYRVSEETVIYNFDELHKCSECQTEFVMQSSSGG